MRTRNVLGDTYPISYYIRPLRFRSVLYALVYFIPANFVDSKSINEIIADEFSDLAEKFRQAFWVASNILQRFQH